MFLSEITYRSLTLRDVERLQDIDASQHIGSAWRDINGERLLVVIDYHDPDWPNGFADHRQRLQATIEGGGAAIGAFASSGRLVGFVTVNLQLFGAKNTYALLDQLFISAEYRRQGVGRQLFALAAAAGKRFGADRLYIAAGSAEETVAFYRALGCVDAVEINGSIFEEDPRDLQLEYVL